MAKSTYLLKDQMIRTGSVDSNEISWSGIWAEDNINTAIRELFNEGLTDSALVGCKLTTKGSQARNWARS
tara:strand:+ start:201 stop:410 length:210 start_codon:yes stop_codon:yes gene_type:complete